MANEFHKNLVGNDLHIARTQVGSGDPNGSVTAGIIGQFFYDTANDNLYVAEAADDSSWVEVTGTGGGGGGVFGTQYTYVASEGESSTTSSTFQQKLRMTTGSLPSGDYRLGYQWMQNYDRSKSADNEVRVEQDDTTQLVGPVQVIAKIDDEEQGYYLMGGFKKVTLSGVHTFDIDFRETNNETTRIKQARLELWRVT